MSVETCEQLAGWDAVQGALGEIRACHGEFESFFGEVFDQLDGLASELTNRGKQWLAERQQVQSEIAQRAEEIERQRATLAERQRELEAAVGDASQTPLATPDPALEELLAEARREREQMQGVQDAVQAQVARLAEVATELANARTGPGGAPETGSDDGELTQQICNLREKHAELQQQHVELEQERALLEGELESVRNRAAEMTESVAEQKRALARQQAEWADELRQMRRLMEGISRRLSEAPPAPAPAPAATPQAAAALEAGASSDPDPALDSVMAQFQMLQQDLERRRGQTA